MIFSNHRDMTARTMTEFHEALMRVEDGTLKVFPRLGNRSCSYEEFFTADGWEFGFFDDNSSWDYLDWVRPPKGRTDLCQLDYDAINQYHDDWMDDEQYATAKCMLMNYHPSEKAWDEIYAPALHEIWEWNTRGPVKSGRLPADVS